MLPIPTFLGISLVPRKNRRALVAFTYAVLLFAMTTVVVLARNVGEGRQFWTFMVLFFACILVSATFGKFVTYRLFPEGYGGAGFQGAARRYLTLGIYWSWRDDELDEREVAVRNAAYFVAFRAMSIYAVILTPLAWATRPGIAVLTLHLLAIPLMTMAITLPQAVVLWTEPDVPEEAKV